MESMFQKEFENFAKRVQNRIKSAKKISIIYDSDSDGCCSAALLSIFLSEFLKKNPSRLISCFHDVDAKLKRIEEDLIFILDTQPKEIDSPKLVIIDHHLVQKIPKKSIMFNPTLIDENSYIATSCLIYKILSNLSDMIESCWIAAIGIKADKSEDSCKDLLELTYEIFPEFKQVENRLIRLTSVSKNLNDSRIVVDSLIECYNIGNPSFFGKTETSSKLMDVYRKVKKEYEMLLDKTRKLMNTKIFSLYVIDSRFNVQGMLANRLFNKEPKKTIIVCNLNDDMIRGEVRSNDERMFEIFMKSFNETIEEMGGHKKAFGFSLKKEKFKDFLGILSKF